MRNRKVALIVLVIILLVLGTLDLIKAYKYYSSKDDTVKADIIFGGEIASTMNIDLFHLNPLNTDHYYYCLDENKLFYVVKAPTSWYKKYFDSSTGRPRLERTYPLEGIKVEYGTKALENKIAKRLAELQSEVQELINYTLAYGHTHEQYIEIDYETEIIRNLIFGIAFYLISIIIIIILKKTSRRYY